MSEKIQIPRTSPINIVEAYKMFSGGNEEDFKHYKMGSNDYYVAIMEERNDENQIFQKITASIIDNQEIREEIVLGNCHKPFTEGYLYITGKDYKLTIDQTGVISGIVKDNDRLSALIQRFNR
ncbi:MAG: hypothetical protein KJ906_01990 [Nanoarchaeota archaeon]|nr:hypothetical protein [Nanoarchaeota archaeon]